MLTDEQIDQEIQMLLAAEFGTIGEGRSPGDFWDLRTQEYNQHISSLSLQGNTEEAEALVPIYDFCEQKLKEFQP